MEGVNIVGLVRIVPDSLVELRSPTDNLNEARTKMEEYQELRVRLGLFIRPPAKVFIRSFHTNHFKDYLLIKDLVEYTDKYRFCRSISDFRRRSINSQDQKVEIYRPGQEVEMLEAPKSINCNEVMSGFILDMSKI